MAADSSPTFTESDLYAALRECFVPALRRDVISAALVRAASLTLDRDAPGAGIPGVPERYIARIHLTDPSSDQAVTAQLRSTVENRLLGLPSIASVELTLSPPLFPILG